MFLEYTKNADTALRPRLHFLTMKKLLMAAAIALMLPQTRKQLKQVMCILRGGHELYVNRAEPGKLNQKCLTCPYETRGWDLRRESRLDA